MSRRLPLYVAAPWLLAACAPALDWREMRPVGSSEVAALFPCRPASHAREVRLAGERVQLTLHACQAADVTWALGHADLTDPAAVAIALAELRDAAAANLAAGELRTLPLAVPGATPSAAMQRVAFSGKLPDGKAVNEQVAVYAKGLRVYQATALGKRLPAEAVDTFFGGLRAP